MLAAMFGLCFIAALALNAAVVASQCQGGSTCPHRDLSQDAVLLQIRSSTALSQSKYVLAVDACGCKINYEGWSSTRGACVSDSETSASEAAICRKNNSTGASPSKDDCGCQVGHEGWSSTRGACDPDSETHASEAASCRETKFQFAGDEACLCVFDIDFTLTGYPGDLTTCPGNLHLRWIATLSALAAAGLSKTFCGSCFLGICSAAYGSGPGSRWNAYILDNIMRSGPQDNLTAARPEVKRWSYGTNVVSPYVLGQPNKLKPYAVERIWEWYVAFGINISRASTYFFGDRTENIEPFAQRGFNSREVSCDRQTGSMIGYCGATPEEIVRINGNRLCP